MIAVYYFVLYYVLKSLVELRYKSLIIVVSVSCILLNSAVHVVVAPFYFKFWRQRSAALS
jgi:hypothetical protein